MKRLLLLLAAALLIPGAMGFAEESTLIDFSMLGADVALGDTQEPLENEATLIDFSHLAGSSFTDTEKALMKTSLALNNWEVILNSSARTVENQAYSMTREAVTSPSARAFNGEEMANRTILGVRVRFPNTPFNSYALVLPPFDIPAYADRTTLSGDDLVIPPEEQGRGRKFDEYGVVKNVGVVKSLSITVYGANYPYGLGVLLEDHNNQEHQIFIDYLQFDGWRTLTWVNPNYITEVRNRELRKYPLYPRTAPYYKLVGLVIYKDGSHSGGDFVTYVKDIDVVYDLAVMDIERDINDEEIWGILQARQEDRRAAELRRLGDLQVMRYLERQKMHPEPTN
jgi:hypothetical protein